ncbi:RND superfamily putative drug exporter [Paenibacillus sp. BK033]|uniref:MMPL family transporter n=1 Tax=Paenibacillus sp. BK033 TaxID=2512133 RepID=UPI00105395D3|nr:MMPL family transporter [Paenibacillus sp. BK033]TCM92896.1 RND superfamily putative drug exporter [Paenibacillus sp. BK033]
MNGLKRIADAVSGKRGRWITLVLWIVVVGLANALLPSSSDHKDDAAANLVSSAPSVQADALNEHNGIPAIIAWHRIAGLTDEDLSRIQSLSKKLADEPLPRQTELPPLHEMPLPALKAMVSEDGTTFLQTVVFDKNASSDDLKISLEQLQADANGLFPSKPFDAALTEEGLVGRITGPAGIGVDATSLFKDADVSLLIATTLLVLVILLFIYRSPILALIPLVAVGFAYGLTGPILGWMADEGWITYDSQGLSIMTVLLFGAGTDYCLFLIARFRSVLTTEPDKKQALLKSLGDSGGAITMSGLTVVMSLLALLLAEYGAIHRFAVPFSLSILIMMIASLTLVPAMLAILGRASFYPFVPRTPEMTAARAARKNKPLPAPKTKTSFGIRLGEAIVKRPKTIAISTLIVLGITAAFSTQIKFTYDTLSSFPKDMPSREGFDLIGDHFSKGSLAKVQVLVKTDGKALPLDRKLGELANISSVSEPAANTKDASIVSYNVELAMNPYSIEALDMIPVIRSAAEQSLSDAGITDAADKVWIAGATAEQYDTRHETTGDAYRIIPVIIGMIALLLLLYLRSFVAMLYLMGTVLLSYFSALGIGWLVVHYLFGAEAIQGLIPLYAFVFLVALGEDYNIFMVSSIWKKSKTMPLNRAIVEGVAQTGGVITSAGIILAGTFAVLATLPIQVLVQFGTVTAIGVLLDTFIVRSFLVPALTVWIGKGVFWPSKQRAASVKEAEL